MLVFCAIDDCVCVFLVWKMAKITSDVVEFPAVLYVCK